MFYEDCHDTPELEARRPLELAVEDRRLLDTLAAKLQLRPEAVIRVALLALADPRGSRKWA
jgi:hypothetical protein